MGLPYPLQRHDAQFLEMNFNFLTKETFVYKLDVMYSFSYTEIVHYVNFLTISFDINLELSFISHTV